MHLRFSQDIEALLKQLADKPLTLADILEETLERGFSLVIGLLVLPFLLPTLPGLPGPLGFACFLLAVQMAAGRRKPWLPQKIAHLQFPHWLALNLLKNLKQLMGFLEKIAKPRLSRVAESSHAWQLNGVCIAWLAILLILPIPFTNFMPTTAILVLVVATLEADGWLMCFGYGLTIAVSGVFGVLLWHAGGMIQNLLG
jgi:hypothetical protein